MNPNLKVRTSFVSPDNMEILVREGWLPVFIIRNIQNSTLIGKYSRSSVHYFWLAPSSTLFHRWRDGEISLEDYHKYYLAEVVNNISVEETLEKFDILLRASGAKGIVMMGYGEDSKKCHRSTLAKLINSLGYLNEPIKELVI